MNAITRRNALKLGTGLAVAGLGGTARAAGKIPPPDWKVTQGRIHQSIMAWTYNPMPMDELARHCKDIGLVAMEGLSPKFYPVMKDLGLKVSLTGSHGFGKGPTDPAHHPECIAKLREGIDLAKAWGAPNVITFTGMKVDGLEPDTMESNCLACWKEVIGYAEEQGINICLEHLNSRDGSGKMTGHPGYFGDDVDHCVRMIEKIGSPRMKLLFDIYHVQIMNGDVIRRIRQYKDVIAHYHTAGNPGRHEIDDTQEINYPAILQAILETGYEGYVAQEFLPTWEDKVGALRHAAQVCDI